MDEFKDMDKIVLQPGEVLLLRPKHAVTNEQMMELQSRIKASKIRAVIVAPDIEMFVGVAITAPEEPAQPEDDHRATIEDTYDKGHFIQYRSLATGGEWIDAQKFMCSHRFDWKKYEYRLTPPK